MDKFPLVVAKTSTADPVTDHARIGLGQESDFLKGVNGTRSWAYDHGQTGFSNDTKNPLLSRDGLLTLGGYDSTRFTGNLHAFNMAGGGAYMSKCPLRVPVKSMEFGDSRGTIELFQDVIGGGPVV